MNRANKPIDWEKVNRKQQEAAERRRKRQQERMPELIEKRRAQQKRAQERQQERTKEKQAAARLQPRKTTLKPKATSSKSSSRGLKGRTPTATEARLQDQLGSLNCLACAISLGIANPVTSLHHSDGRTKPWAHAKSMSLCDGHHQIDKGQPRIHGEKRQFIDLNGSEDELLAVSYYLIEQPRPWLEETEPPALEDLPEKAIAALSLITQMTEAG